MKISGLCVGGLTLALLGGVASADMVSFMSDASTTTNTTATGVSLDGTIEYSYISGNMGQVIFSLTNTTSSSVGGYLTGIVFNIDSSDSDASATLSSTTNSRFKNTGIEAANPFGTFDAGAALNANWTGGGNPTRGLGVGLDLTLIFDVIASDASTLSAHDFMGAGGDEIALRFRGLANGNSDKQLVTDEPALIVTPLPAPMLAGGAMLGLGLCARRLRDRK